MDIITSLIVVGDYFSNNNPAEDDFAILIVLYMVRFPFYLVVVYYTFLAYRELKGLFIEHLEHGFENYGAMQNWYDRNNEHHHQAPQPQPFTGTGYRLG